MLTQKGIERFNKSRFKSRKVKGRATSSENRKFFVAVMEGTLGVVKKMLTNGGFVKLLWAYVVLARARKTLAVGRGMRIGDGFTFFLYKLVRFQFCFILTISPEECQMKSFGKKNLLLQEKESPGQIHTWCYAHVLNLVLYDVTTTNHASISLFELFQKVGVFFRQSYLRMDMWKEQMSQRHGHDIQSRLNLIGATRWWFKHECLRNI